MRIVAVTDSHLAPHAGAFNDNWHAVRAYVKQTQPDVTVHVGDITVDGVRDPSQFEHVQALSAEWPTPVRYLPGNHDIGDNPPGPDVPAGEPLRPSSLDAYRAAFGPDYWSFTADGWCLLGLNAQLMGTQTPDEALQWEWLASVLLASAGMPAVLFLHKPLFQESPADDRPHHRYVPAAARRRLLALLAVVRLRLVVSGHTHQYRDQRVDGVRHVWLPSTAFFLPDELQDRVGEKITGLGVIELAPGHVRVDLVCPDGVTRHNVLDYPIYPRVAEARARLQPARAPSR